ncbi:MAG: D-mannonate oxidoreductase, partial [Proteiniphilum sp.]|nr:D-mannonate oxidoreductase [Proteiniphilum sp.]
MNNNGFNYTGKVVSVTGAGGVLGAQIALAFAEYGASVALIDRD